MTAMQRFWTRQFKAQRILASAMRLALARLRLGRAALPGPVSLGSSVRLAATAGGTLRIGPDSVVDQDAVIMVRQGSLQIGPKAFVGQGSVIASRDAIIIGRDALIAEYVTIRDQDHAIPGPGPFARNGFVTAPIRIGDNVWLGAKVTVLKGVTIGNNVVVGANSVVTCDLPDNVVAAGCPARVLRQIGTATPGGAA